MVWSQYYIIFIFLEENDFWLSGGGATISGQTTKQIAKDIWYM